MPLTMEQMEKEITSLHETLEARGINSRKTQDIFGREVRPALPTRAQQPARQMQQSNATLSHLLTRTYSRPCMSPLSV